MSDPEPTVAERSQYYSKGGNWAEEEDEPGLEVDQLPVPEEPEGHADENENETHIASLRTQEEKKLLEEVGLNSHVISLVAEQVARLLSAKAGPQSLIVAALKGTLDMRDTEIKSWLSAQQTEEATRLRQERDDKFTALDKRIDDIFARIKAIETEQQAASMQYMEGLKVAADELRRERKKLQQEEVRDDISDAKSDKSRAVNVDILLARAEAAAASKPPQQIVTQARKKVRRPAVPL